MQSANERRKLGDSIVGFTKLNRLKIDSTKVNPKPTITSVKIRNVTNDDGSIRYRFLQKTPLFIAFNISAGELKGNINGNIVVNVKCKVSGKANNLSVIMAKGTATLSKLIRAYDPFIEIPLPNDIIEGDYSYEILYSGQQTNGYIILVPEVTFKVAR